MTTAIAGFPPLLLVLALASTTAVSLAALAAAALRRHSAALRHFLWLLALATPLVALPLYWFHPYLELKVLSPAPIHVAPALPLPAHDLAPLQITPPESSPAKALLPPPPALPTQLLHLIESCNPWLAAWTLGALIIAARLLLAYAHVRRLLRTHSGTAPAELLTSLHDASAFFGLARAPHLRISPLIEIPLCHGLLRPTVLFPESWREWNSERIDICLTHELAHLRRRDLAAMALGQAACLLCWFNPLVWLAAARLRDEAENAADDLVLARNIRPETYAANLVALTEKFRASALAPTIALSMARPNRLRSRIESILDATLLRRAPKPRLLLALALSAAALLLLAMSLRLTAQETKPATNIVTNPPIYIQFDGISAGFFGPVHGDASISDNSLVPGTNFKLSVSCKSYTATKANLVFVAEKPNGPAEKQPNGQTLQPIDSKSEEVSVSLGQVAHFKIFGQIDVTASPTLTLPAPVAPAPAQPAALQKQMLEAACKGDIKTVDALLAQGVNVNDPAFSQTTGRTLLGNVATVGQTEMINHLADHGADLNAKDKGNQVALTYALNFGKDDAACALIAHGADFNVSDRSNPNAAWIAASMFYCPDALQLMIQKGINVLGTDPRGENIISHISHFGVLSKSHPSYFGGTPYSDVVQKAYEAREQRVVEMLLAAGVDANGRDGTETPLMTMLRSNHFAAARALLNHGANVKFKDADGNTALVYLFSWSGRNDFPLDILQTLLNYGADPNASEHWNIQPPQSTPLLEEAIGLATHQENLTAYPQAIKILLDHGATFFGVTDYKVQDLLRAAARGDLPAIQKAVQEGAGINAASGSGWTALAISTSLGYDDCANWLLDQGADVTSPAGKAWRAPLTFAVDRGQADLVDKMIAKGAKPGLGDGGLSSAVKQNNQRIFDALIKAGANPKPIGLSTITIGNISYHPIDNLPLFICIKNGQTAMALTLLDKGADPEPQGPRDNQNLAYFAVHYNRPEILQALLNHGANPTLKDSHGVSPIDLAQKSHPNLVPMLQAAAAKIAHTDSTPAGGASAGVVDAYPIKNDIIATTYWNAKTPGPFYAALPFNDLADPDAAKKWLPPSWTTAAPADPQPHSACLGHWLKITNQAGASCYAQWEDFGPGADTDPGYVFGNQPPKNAQAPALDLSPAAAQFLGLDDKHKTVAWQFINQKDIPPGPWLPAQPNTPTTTP